MDRSTPSHSLRCSGSVRLSCSCRRSIAGGKSNGSSPTPGPRSWSRSATRLFAVPTTYRMLLRHPGFDARLLRSLRLCVSASEPLPADLIDEWRVRTGHDIVDGLGTTEMTHVFISNRPGDVRPGLIGY